jgi:hypothetical protein
VISDLQGQVVCRYTGPGQKHDWFEYFRYRLFARFKARSPMTPGATPQAWK